jgi:hypothetical protein
MFIVLILYIYRELTDQYLQKLGFLFDSESMNEIQESSKNLSMLS